jgi:caffeoyl-CoA O-methyltransferase
VTIHHADALTWLRAQPPAPRYDLLFIDAEKRAYPEYLKIALPLLTPDALIIGDNSLLFGALSGEAPDAASVEAKDAMLCFNAMLADPTHFEGILLPTSEGLTVARRVS